MLVWFINSRIERVRAIIDKEQLKTDVALLKDDSSRKPGYRLALSNWSPIGVHLIGRSFNDECNRL